VLNNAAASGNIELFDHLVSRGADPTKSIALHHAARCKDPAKTKAMITHLVTRHGFDVEADDNATGLRPLDSLIDYEDWGTPMRFAYLFKNQAAIEALKEYGAGDE